MKPYFLILAACLIWGTYGIFVKKLDYSPEVIVFSRFLFGAVFLVGFAALKGDLSRLKPSAHWKKLILIGLINAGSWLMLTRSIAYTSVANGFILNYTAPCYVLLLAAIVLKERLEGRSLLALILSFAGIFLITGHDGLNQGNNVLLGNILGLASGVLYAVYIMTLKTLPGELLGVVSNVYMSFTIAAVSLPLAATSLPSITWPGIPVLILLGFLVQGVGTTMYMVGLRSVKAQHASILSYFEALFAMMFAVLFLNERMTAGFLSGVGLIIAGGFLIISGGVKGRPLKNNCPSPADSH